jgi:excisionase family DNA binding protein
VSRKHELEDALDLDLVKRAATAFIREQIDAALKERLPQLLMRAGETRRPPQPAGGAAEDLGPQYLTRQQVAQITGYSMRKIVRLIDSGKLRACGPRRDRITRFEVDRMMAMQDDCDAAAVDEDADVTAAVDGVFGVIK